MTTRHLDNLLGNNRRWAEEVERARPGFFQKLSEQQSPRYLWIGCSDSRVPANDITGLLPGELFVHRNVANLVIHTDVSCMAVLQFAVDVLKVEHVILCGHYGCGGVVAAGRGVRLGLIDNWLRSIQELAEQWAEHLEAIPAEPDRLDRLCELNVVAQAFNVCRSTIVEEAWRRGQPLFVHGLIYRLTDGLLHDLGFFASSAAEAKASALRAARNVFEPAGR